MFQDPGDAGGVPETGEVFLVTVCAVDRIRSCRVPCKIGLQVSYRVDVPA